MPGYFIFNWKCKDFAKLPFALAASAIPDQQPCGKKFARKLTLSELKLASKQLASLDVLE